jgi:lipopolysaccharide transport system permease protein
MTRAANPDFASSEEQWDSVVSADVPLFSLRLAEVWSYRYLVVMLVRRDFVTAYKQTILGPLWFVIPPLVSTLTFTVIFGQIANLSTDGQPQFLFYMAGIVMWGHFSSTVTGNSSIFAANAALFSKVFFPRLVIPITNVLSGLLHFAVHCSLLAACVGYVMWAGSSVTLRWTLLLIPILILISAMLGLSVGVIASALTTRYKDLSFLVTFGLSLWMYLSPVIYPQSAVPATYRWLLLLNPMSSIITTFRQATLGAGVVPYWGLAYSFVIAATALFLALVVFNRFERHAMDTI